MSRMGGKLTTEQWLKFVDLEKAEGRERVAELEPLPIAPSYEALLRCVEGEKKSRDVDDDRSDEKSKNNKPPSFFEFKKILNWHCKELGYNTTDCHEHAEEYHPHIAKVVKSGTNVGLILFFGVLATFAGAIVSFLLYLVDNGGVPLNTSRFCLFMALSTTIVSAFVFYVRQFQTVTFIHEAHQRVQIKVKERSGNKDQKQIEQQNLSGKINKYLKNRLQQIRKKSLESEAIRKAKEKLAEEELEIRHVITDLEQMIEKQHLPQEILDALRNDLMRQKQSLETNEAIGKSFRDFLFEEERRFREKEKRLETLKPYFEAKELLERSARLLQESANTSASIENLIAQIAWETEMDLLRWQSAVASVSARITAIAQLGSKNPNAVQELEEAIAEMPRLTMSQENA